MLMLSTKKCDTITQRNHINQLFKYIRTEFLIENNLCRIWLAQGNIDLLEYV